MGNRVIHDTEMTINEETGALMVRFPGWRQDPSREFTFLPGGEGSGTGFPLNARLLLVSEGVMSAINSAAGIQMDEDTMTISQNSSTPSVGGLMTLQSYGLDVTNARVEIKVGGLDVAGFETDDVNTLRYGVFDKAASPNVQPSPIDAPTDLPEALTAIADILSAMRSLGHLEESV